MTRRIIAIILLLMGSTLTITAASRAWREHVPAKDHARTSPIAGRPDAVAGGAMLYRDHCAQCHKADARGDGHKKPSLRTPQMNAAADGDLEWFLRQGDLGHGMPSWSSIPEAQRWQIIAYLRSLP